MKNPLINVFWVTILILGSGTFWNAFAYDQDYGDCGRTHERVCDVAPEITHDRFVDNVDSTSTDTLSGLIWQQNASAYSMGMGEIGTYMTPLNSGIYNDWRLPTESELIEMCDYIMNLPSHQCDSFDLYWTSDSNRAGYVCINFHAKGCTLFVYDCICTNELSKVLAVRNTIDNCPYDSNKIEPLICGCGEPETDTDDDDMPDCNDGCPNDPNKIAPGNNGCGNLEDEDDSGDDGGSGFCFINTLRY